MKKNKMMRAASALLVATLLSTSVISGTFAKYTSEASASDSAKVAKWSFTVGDKDIVNSETISFELFNTVKEADTTVGENHLKTTDGTIIAPGTGGSFEIKLQNKSEVTAKYAIEFSATNANSIPIEYSKDGKKWNSSVDSLDIAASDATVLDYENGAKTTDTVTVYWRWAFEDETKSTDRDTSDTLLGKEANASVQVTAKITAIQVD